MEAFYRLFQSGTCSRALPKHINSEARWLRNYCCHVRFCAIFSHTFNTGEFHGSLAVLWLFEGDFQLPQLHFFYIWVVLFWIFSVFLFFQLLLFSREALCVGSHSKRFQLMRVQIALVKMLLYLVIDRWIDKGLLIATFPCRKLLDRVVYTFSFHKALDKIMPFCMK